MINFVIVSHSQALAEGLVALTNQIKAPECKIIPAGGLEDPPGGIGTDTIKIIQAIEDAFSDDGVIVFVDLGSAILGTQTALDLLDPIMAEKVHLSYAPLIEGTIAAVVAASSGASLEEALSEANEVAALKLSLNDQ